MNPDKVEELIESFVEELALPVYVVDGGPRLIYTHADSPTRERIDKVINRWFDGNHRSYSISIGQSLSYKNKATTYQALHTHRCPEVKDILKSLIVEQSLPLKIVDHGFKLAILAEDVPDYRTEDMTKLEALIEEEGLDVQVRHAGFTLYPKEDSPEIQFSQAETVADRLASALEEHRLQVKLLHIGFQLEKNREDEVHIAEVVELTRRLELMTGIEYVQGGYGPINDVPDPEIHWTHGDINTGLPMIGDPRA